MFPGTLVETILKIKESQQKFKELPEILRKNHHWKSGSLSNFPEALVEMMQKISFFKWNPKS